jgi:Fic family protein
VKTVIIETPKSKVLSFKEYTRLISDEKVNSIMIKANESYLHWEKLKNKNWMPVDESEKEKIWSAIKLQRLFKSKPTVISDKEGNQFALNVEKYSEFLHVVDKEMAGNYMGIKDFTQNDKDAFITRNIIEESIASSILEGANTSRSAAKEMLRKGRKPLNYGEQMVVNNHKAMEIIEKELKFEPMSLDLIFKLHKVITYKTIEEDKQGCYRDTFDDKGKRLKIFPFDHETVAYVTPDREFVEREMLKFVDFANDVSNSDFTHPLIKAIMLHFWIGLIHPFEDGNGRLARLMFYWYVLRKDYWAFSYISLSERILKSPNQYAWSYIYSEQDNNDLTYFIEYNINKIKLARENFKIYIRKKQDENRDIVNFIKGDVDLNDRQIKLVQFLNVNQQRFTSITEHQSIYGVKRATAATDLRGLYEKGYLSKKKRGRNVFYVATKKIFDLFI